MVAGDGADAHAARLESCEVVQHALHHACRRVVQVEQVAGDDHATDAGIGPECEIGESAEHAVGLLAALGRPRFEVIVPGAEVQVREMEDPCPVHELPLRLVLRP